MVDIQAWFLLSVSVTLFWGLSGVLAKYSTGRLGVARVALLIASVEGVMYSAAFLVLREPHHITLYEGIFASASCIVGVSGYLCYFESIMEGQVAIAGTISAAYPALTVIGAVLLLSEALGPLQAIGVAVIIVCVVAISYEPDRTAANALNRRSLLFASAAFFAWGAWSLSSKVAIEMVGPGNMFGFYVVSSLTAPVIYAWFRHVRPHKRTFASPARLIWYLGAASLALNVFGAFAYTYALDTGMASLVVPISSAYPIVTALFAIAILREKLNAIQALALVGIVLGLVAIGVTV
ncbi:MAG: DMT family transporter [Methanobacteriota archaeon]|nr:MAG: DMT family transporter [Euryarchaeota archaeon]